MFRTSRQRQNFPVLENMKVALIVGAGKGLSASLARKLGSAGLQIALAARNKAKLGGLAGEMRAQAFACDASDPTDVVRLFDDVQAQLGAPDVVVYNASARIGGRITELDPAEVKRTLAVTAFGGFLSLARNPEGRRAAEDLSGELFCSVAAARSCQWRRGKKLGAMVSGTRRRP